MTACKIGWVTMKASGLKVRAFEPAAAESVHPDFIRNVRQVAGAMPAMAGYFLVAWDGDDEIYHSWNINADSARGIFELPGFLHAVAMKAVANA